MADPRKRTLPDRLGMGPDSLARVKIDLGVQLLALYLLFVGPVVLAALVFDNLASNRLKADVQAADLALARAIAFETNTFMDNALQAVRQLGGYTEVIQADQEGMRILFRTLLSVRSDVNLIYRLDPDGTMLFHYPVGPESTVGWDFSMRDYFQRALSTRNPLVSKGRISPTTHQAVATAVMPLWDRSGNFLGLVATNIKLQFLSHTLSSIVSGHQPQEGLGITIVDASGQVIANPDPGSLLGNAFTEFPRATEEVLALRTGSLISEDTRGVEMLFSFVPIPSSGWGVIVSRPTSLAFATPRAIHNGALAALAIFLGFGLLFWIALSRQVILPLEKLASFSQSISAEQGISAKDRLTLAGIARRRDQMGHLTRSLQHMESSIEARINELSTLLQTSAAVVSSLDPQTVLDRILEQLERLMGIKMAAIIALDEERGVFRPRASRGLSEHYVRNMAIDPKDSQFVPMRAIRSGQAIQISDTDTDPAYVAARPRAHAESYRSILAVPLQALHAPPSTLVVYQPEPHVFSEREIGLLTSFANHAAMAIENANLYALSGTQLHEQTRRLEALIQSMSSGLILEDLEGNVLYANRRLKSLVGIPLEEIEKVPVKGLLEQILSLSREKTRTRAAVMSALNDQGPRTIEIVLNEPAPTRYLRLQVFDVTDSNSMPIGRGLIFQDVTQLRELDRMKSSLVSTVSHELRTPLAAIKGYATTLLAEDVEWDLSTQREFLTIISAEADRLSDMVDNLLDMSRIEAGNLTVSRIPCDLEEMIHNASIRATPSPGRKLIVAIPNDLPPIMADPQRIEVVLRNLIENASKYAGEKSLIRVSAAQDGDLVVVRVEDQGPGIPTEHQDHVFESFYRVEHGLRRQVAGAGLGLAISQGFIRAHGGEIWLEPRSRGTCVAFSLPYTRMEAAPSDATVSTPPDSDLISESLP